MQALNTSGGNCGWWPWPMYLPTGCKPPFRAQGPARRRFDVPRERHSWAWKLSSPAGDRRRPGDPGDSSRLPPAALRSGREAGKHVFLEMPWRSMPRACAASWPPAGGSAQGLTVAVGLQRRHDAGYRETIARLQDGAIGEIR